MNDEEIIELFFARSEQALAETDKKYGKLCRKISFNILGNGEDAEECVNDAFLAVWNKIPPEKPNPLGAYVCKIVRNISLKLYARNNAEKRTCEYSVAMDELEEMLFSPDTVEAEVENAELTHVLQEFLDLLNEENRVIFLRRYWFSESYEEIAERVNLAEKTVSVRLTRIRKQLKKYLTEREVL